MTREAVPGLWRALFDESAEVREFAAAALGSVGEPASGAVDDLIIATEDRDRSVRIGAIEALGGIGEAAARGSRAIARAAPADPGVARVAPEALGQMGEPGLEALLELAGHEDAYVRHQAVLRMKEADVVPARVRESVVPY